MEKILIGSRAIKHWCPDFPREPKDTDYIGFGAKTEDTDYIDLPHFFYYGKAILELNDLYTLKLSHIFWDITWDKTIGDIQFLKRKGCKIQIELFNALVRHWRGVHGELPHKDDPARFLGCSLKEIILGKGSFNTALFTAVNYYE